jgi:RNA polymerase sigma-70 factor, ECF subfamily
MYEMNASRIRGGMTVLTTDRRSRELDELLTRTGGAASPLTEALEDDLAELTVATSRAAGRQSEAQRDRIRDAIAFSSPDLLAFLERRVGPAEAPDLLADTMTTAWRSADRMPLDAAGARMWLFGLARDAVAYRERAGLRRSRHAGRLRRRLVAVEPARAASGDLPDDLREIVRLVHGDGFTLVEAAALDGIPLNVARDRYRSARRRLAAGVRSRAA